MLFSSSHPTNRAQSQRVPGSLLLCLLMIVLCCSAGYASPGNNAQIVRFSTAIAPLAFIIEQIGEPYLSVETLLPPGQDPHLFEPGPRLFHRLSKTQVYLMAGLPFERALVKKIKTRQKKLTIIDLTTELDLWGSDSSLDEHDCLDEPRGDHAHSEHDPHFWLGALQLRQFITAAARVIIDTDPAHAKTYQKNAARLLARLETVHTQNATLLRPYRNRIFFAYHPSFAYFARTYGLRQQTVEINGRQPGPRSIAALVKQARAAGVRTIFVQPQYDTKSAQAIATAINGTVLPLDPLAKDVIQNLETMAAIIARCFMQEPSQP